MADEKKTKKEKPAVEKADSKPATEAKPATETKTEVPAEAKSESKPEAKSYSRGEGQKAVTQAYKDNWNTIFGKKKR
jgi:hypothetical protein